MSVPAEVRTVLLRAAERIDVCDEVLGPAYRHEYPGVMLEVLCRNRPFREMLDALVRERRKVRLFDALIDEIDRMIDYGAEGGTFAAGRNKGLTEARLMLVAATMDVPEMSCPRCKAIEPDFDGFGMLSHTKPAFPNGCGWCSHPTTTDGVCSCCGEKRA